MSRYENQAFKASLFDVASRLNQENIQGIYFLHKEKIKKQCTCSAQSGAECVTCPHHYGLTGVTIIDQLLERGVFTESNTEQLVEMLDQIGRVDLANTFKETYVRRHLTNDSAPSSPGLDSGSASPRTRPSPTHPLPSGTRPTELINLRQLPRIRPDLETDFPSTSPRTPSHIPYTPTYSPSPRHTPTHLPYNTASSKMEPYTGPIDMYTPSTTPSTRYSNEDDVVMRDSPAPPEGAYCVCGKQSRSNAYCEYGKQSRSNSCPVETETDSVMLTSVTHSLPVNASTGFSVPENRFSQSEHVCQPLAAKFEPLADTSPMDTSSTASPSDSLTQDFAVVLSRIELKEVNQVIQNSSISETISEKFRNPEPAPKHKQTEASDGFEFIDAEECQPLQCESCLNNKPPLRAAFSLDNIKSKFKKRQVPHQHSVPVVSSSCINLVSSDSSCGHDGGSGHYTSHGASPGTPLRQFGSAIMKKFGSKDSGMDSSESLQGVGETKNAFLEKDGVVFFEWKIDRKKLCRSIYEHKSDSFDKKARICIGKCSSKHGVNLLIKMYPNGLDKDLGTHVTLTIGVIGVSNRKATYSLDCTFRGFDYRNDSMIMSRQKKFLLSQKQVTIGEFLSHDIIKQSTAQKFRFVFKFQLNILVDKEWVVVNE